MIISIQLFTNNVNSTVKSTVQTFLGAHAFQLYLCAATMLLSYIITVLVVSHRVFSTLADISDDKRKVSIVGTQE